MLHRISYFFLVLSALEVEDDSRVVIIQLTQIMSSCYTWQLFTAVYYWEFRLLARFIEIEIKLIEIAFTSGA